MTAAVVRDRPSPFCLYRSLHGAIVTRTVLAGRGCDPVNTIWAAFRLPRMSSVDPRAWYGIYCCDHDEEPFAVVNASASADSALWFGGVVSGLCRSDLALTQPVIQARL